LIIQLTGPISRTNKAPVEGEKMTERFEFPFKENYVEVEAFGFIT